MVAEIQVFLIIYLSINQFGCILCLPSNIHMFAMNAKTSALPLNRVFNVCMYRMELKCVERERGRKKKAKNQAMLLWILSHGDVWTSSIPSTYIYNCTCIFMVTTSRYELIGQIVFFFLRIWSSVEWFNRKCEYSVSIRIWCVFHLPEIRISTYFHKVCSFKNF